MTSQRCLFNMPTKASAQGFLEAVGFVIFSSVSSLISPIPHSFNLLSADHQHHHHHFHHHTH